MQNNAAPKCGLAQLLCPKLPHSCYSPSVCVGQELAVPGRTVITTGVMKAVRWKAAPPPRKQTFGIAPLPLPVALPARRNAHRWPGVVRSQTH